MTKQFWGILLAVIVILGGIFFFTNQKNSTAPSSTKSSALTQHTKGAGTTGVTLMEYGDFQCPGCQQYEAVLEPLLAKYGDRIKFQFRYFPLVSIHPNAFGSARAAEAAGLQGKFWEMHNLLYEQNNWIQWTQSDNPQPLFNQYAQQIGLDMNRFKQDFSSSKVNDAINADLAEANRLGLTGTPTFFLDGKKIEPGDSIESFQRLIDAEIAKKTNDAGATTSTTPVTNQQQ